MWQLPPTVPKPSQHSKRERVIEKVARLTDEIVRRRIKLESDTLEKQATPHVFDQFALQEQVAATLIAPITHRASRI